MFTFRCPYQIFRSIKTLGKFHTILNILLQHTENKERTGEAKENLWTNIDKFKKIKGKLKTNQETQRKT